MGQRPVNSSVIAGFATSFTLTQAATITVGELAIVKSGNGGGGNVWLEIFSVDANFIPLALLATSAKVATSSIVDGVTQFTFTGVTLNPDNYAMVIRTGDGYASDFGLNNYIGLDDCNGSPISGVVTSVYRYSEGFWNSWANTFACGLKI